MKDNEQEDIAKIEFDEKIENDDDGIFNDEHKKGSPISITGNEKKEYLLKKLDVELQRRNKEIALHNEIIKSIEIKKRKRKSFEKFLVIWGLIISILVILYFMGLNFVKNPLDLKYEIMYLYDISTISIKQETNTHRSFITFMNLAEEENKDLTETAEALYVDLGFERIYNSNIKSLDVILKNSNNLNFASSKNSVLLFNTYNEYLDAVYNLNALLLDMKNMTYDEYKNEYIIRLQEVTSLQYKLNELFNEETIFGF